MGQITLDHPVAASAVRDLFADTLIWDNHTCTTIQPARAESLAQLERHRAAGVDLVTLNVGFDAAPAEHAVVLLADFRRWIRAHAQHYALIERVDDIERARRESKLGVCFNLEGGNCLFGQVSMVSLYYELGVRWMLFAYNRTNALAGGCQDEDRGLSALGREVLREMERVGMVVCCSHIGERSAMEIMARAEKPVIFSHSNPRALWDHARNISDEAIRACARTGGVVGINGIGPFLGANDTRVETMVRHIDYVAQLVGAEHVGIGLDYAFDQDEVQEFVKAHPETYPPAKYPQGLAMMEPERIPELAEGLLRRGYGAQQVRNIFGGNHLRVARQVWK
jgi:membrane dipeptidase